MASALERDENDNPIYAFKASLIGSACQFTLAPEALRWRIGRRDGGVPYDRIRMVRLSYRPVTMQSHRFVAEIWPANDAKIQIVSVSWRSVMDQQRLDAAYAAFIAELHRRIAAAGGETRCFTGLPAAIYWVGVVLFAAVLLAIAALALRALKVGQWSTSAIIGAFFAAFVYQIGNYFRRNWPTRYSPDSLPAAVLPNVEG
jgi:hypothetical protein